jgi:hypothetical protein
VKARVKGCGTTQAAFRSEFAVCSVFDLSVTNNFGGWYGGGKPAIGLELSCRAASEPTAYCYFPNPIIEGCGIGIRLVSTLGNNFLGGTSEGHSGNGVEALANSSGDKFIGVDFEANGGDDVRCFGQSIRLIDCDSEKLVAILSGAKGCVIRGGLFKDVNVGDGSIDTNVTEIYYNRTGPNGLPSGGNFTKASGALRVVSYGCRNFSTGEMWN